VARPCQYTRGDDRAGCDPRFWASDRYGEKVVQAVNAAIDWAQDAARAPRIGLVGYSGGGAVAALVAARRDDVAWLATVAGNLDHATWTRLLDLTPLSGSLNPVDEAARLRLLAQLHLVGGDDETMPAAVAQAYARKLARPDRVHVVIVPGFDHKCCWVRDWPEVLCRYQFWGLPYCAPAAGQGADVVRPGARRPAG